MNIKYSKQIKDVEKLCKVENFILNNGSAITEQDKEILKIAENVMQNYTYGWYIYEENIIEQLHSINKFKIYILDLIGGVENSCWQNDKINAIIYIELKGGDYMT